MNQTSIEYLDFTSNPIVGCDMTLPCAERCWARRMARRLRAQGKPQYQDVVDDRGNWTGKTAFNETALTELLTKRKPGTVGLCFMGDAFHESVPDEWLDRIFAVMALCPQHKFLVLTKRARRMREYWRDPAALRDRWSDALLDARIFPGDARRAVIGFPSRAGVAEGIRKGWRDIVLPNLGLAVSCEDQKTADERIPDLLATPAAMRFVSLEPMLGAVDVSDYLYGQEEHGIDLSRPVGSKVGCCVGWTPPLDWAICGGESGPGARPMHPAWPCRLRDDCVAAGVPFTFKQWGAWVPCLTDDPFVFERHAKCRRISITGQDVTHDMSLWVDSDAVMRPATKKAAGRLLDGKLWDQRPEGWE